MPQKLTIDYRVLFDQVPGHRGFLLIEHNWATGTFANESQISLIFGPGSTRQEFEVGSGRLRGFLAVVKLGTDHIWTGFDHLMFLIALLLPAMLVRQDGRWRDGAAFMPSLINVVKIVTAFTIAHTITLSLASLGVVSCPRLIEVTIAASIAIAAADLVYPLFRGRVWIVVFGFGLFHGFGFAGALEEMGLLRENLALSLLGFNLGVELGQFAIVILLFPVLFVLRRLAVYRQLLLPAAATLMIVISIGWVVERAMDVNLPGLGTVRLDGLARTLMTGPRVLSRLAQEAAMRHPSAPAVRCDGERCRDEELARQANGLADVLVAAGLTRGKRVAVWLGKSAKVPVAFHGTFAGGGTLVPIDPKSPLDQVVRIIRSTGATHLVTERERRANVVRALAACPSITYVIGPDPGEGIPVSCSPWSDVPAGDHSPEVSLMELDSGAHPAHLGHSTGQPKLIRTPTTAP